MNPTNGMDRTIAQLPRRRYRLLRYLISALARASGPVQVEASIWDTSGCPVVVLGGGVLPDETARRQGARVVRLAEHLGLAQRVPAGHVLTPSGAAWLDQRWRLDTARWNLQAARDEARADRRADRRHAWCMALLGAAS